MKWGENTSEGIMGSAHKLTIQQGTNLDWDYGEDEKSPLLQLTSDSVWELLHFLPNKDIGRLSYENSQDYPPPVFAHDLYCWATTARWEGRSSGGSGN